jgi:hypothetical protein
MDFYFAVEEFEAGGIEAFEFNDLDCVAFEFLSHLDPLVDAAAVPFTQDFVEEDLVLADLDPLIALLEAPQSSVFGAGAMPKGRAGRWSLEGVFLFCQSSHFQRI